MNIATFLASIDSDMPSAELSVPLQALWWDAKGDWTRAHQLVDELETLEATVIRSTDAFNAAALEPFLNRLRTEAERRTV